MTDRADLALGAGDPLTVVIAMEVVPGKREFPAPSDRPQPPFRGMLRGRGW